MITFAVIPARIVLRFNDSSAVTETTALAFGQGEVNRELFILQLAMAISHAIDASSASRSTGRFLRA
jgi:hypothetical protein